MTNFNKSEIWEGYWCFEPVSKYEFPIFQTLNFLSWSGKERNAIDVQIESFDESSSSPTNQQIETLEFIIEKQTELVQEIFRYYQNLILPVYHHAIDLEEEEIIHSKSELSKLFGINKIIISPYKASDLHYFSIDFDFKYDTEHGLNILFKNTTAIDFAEEENNSYEAINIYETGLINKNGEPIQIRIEPINSSEAILQQSCYFNEPIEFTLKKGTYRTYYTWENIGLCRSFYVPVDLKKFSVKQIFTMDIKSSA